MYRKLQLCYKVGLLFTLFFYSTSPTVWAQDEPDKDLEKINKYKEDVKYFLMINDLASAAKAYASLDSLDPENIEYIYGMAICYSYIPGEKHKAMKYLLHAYNEDDSLSNINYHLAKAYHVHHDFHDAVKHYKKYIYELKAIDTFSVTEATRRIEECRNGLALMASPVEATIENLGPRVNSKYPDFVPVISEDEKTLIFTSRRPGSTGGLRDPIDFHYYEDIYITRHDAHGKWRKPERISDSINTKYHDASVGLSPDGKELFIYKDNKDGSGNIYYSFMYDDKSWSAPKKLPTSVNHERSREPSASITADGNTIYFSSNRTHNGSRDMDIYRLRKLPNGEWAAPENLGNIINTPFDEDSPYVLPDGKTLYFSSKGHNTMGGYDVFVSYFNDSTNTWSAPANLGYPINSAEDDIYMVWSSDGIRAYYSTIRDDTYGEKDIYKLTLPVKHLNLIVFKGEVTDRKTRRPLVASVEVYDNDSQKLLSAEPSNALNGAYRMILPPKLHYGIRIARKGYLFKSFNVDLPSQFDYFEITENAKMEKCAHLKFETLNNVFHTHNYNLRVESYAEINELNKLIKDNPEYSVIIATHTSAYRDSLLSSFESQAFADAVVEKMKELGCDPSRVRAMGLGDDFPIASNTSERGREMNERIEYIVVKNSELHKIKKEDYVDINPFIQTDH